MDYEITKYSSKLEYEYDEAKKRAVAKAIINALTIAAVGYAVLKFGQVLSNYATDHMTLFFQESEEIAQKFPTSNVVLNMVSKTFEITKHVVDRFGVVGVVLASKAIEIIGKVIKDTKETLKVKQQIKDFARVKESIEKYKGQQDVEKATTEEQVKPQENNNYDNKEIDHQENRNETEPVENENKKK